MNKFIFALLIFQSSASSAFEGRIEKILGYQATNNGVNFQVTSGGCTFHSDFKVKVVRKAESGFAEVTLIRMRPDPCFPFIPAGERIGFSYDDMRMSASESFVIQNKNGIVRGWIW